MNKPKKITKEDWGKLRIAEIDGWIITAIGEQHVLGWLIIFPPREIIDSLAHLKNDELIKFKEIALICEKLLQKSFGAEWFNYSQAGNNIKKLHIHLQPRYSKPQMFEDYEFTDEGWGHPVKSREANKLPDKEIVFSIVRKLRKNLAEMNINNITIFDI